MNVTTIKREMEIVKRALNYEPKIIRYVQHLGGRPDEPHGPLHGQLVTFVVADGQSEMTIEPLTYEQEIEFGYSREDYEEMVNRYPHMKTTPNEFYETYEKWLRASTCKCGYHGLDGKQPCLGDKSWVEPIQNQAPSFNVEAPKPDPTPEPAYPKDYKPRPSVMAERVKAGGW